jgi:hypothetical protein
MNFKSAFTLLIFLFILTDCKKKKADEPEPETPPSSTTSINNLDDLFTANGVPPQSTQVSSTTQQTITLSGVKVTIPSNAFVTSTNGTVTGNVSITAKGIFTKSDIILSGAPANAAGKLISTKGCVKVSATQNSQTLRISPTASVYVQIPEATMSPNYNLKRYYANTLSPTDTSLCWKAYPDTSNVPVGFDTLAGKYYYNARIDSVNWLNTGYVWDTVATKTSVTITVGSQFNKNNCAVYISLNGSLVVGALYELSPNTYMITNIPVGKAVHIVGIAVINNQYYSAVLPVTITASFNQPLNLTATTLSQIQTQLSSLP